MLETHPRERQSVGSLAAEELGVRDSEGNCHSRPISCIGKDRSAFPAAELSLWQQR